MSRFKMSVTSVAWNIELLESIYESTNINQLQITFAVRAPSQGQVN